ncbi:cell division protein ZapA [Maridesulfovibrio sp.]|uniref:cell division protein ZapA n=1 Tax=Maridesulfovibrio sp. TaxID=2795000 RepID=UPI002A188F59|nr:cell division protein ZapA [Maridesulfovibrio sp.]
MPRYTLPVLGLEISFKTDADKERIEAAKDVLEERYSELARGGRDVSKEKLLTCLALSLADDYLEHSRKLETMEEKINALLEK